MTRIQNTSFSNHHFTLTEGSHHQKDPKTLLKEKLQELYTDTPPTIENIREIANQYFPEIAQEIATMEEADIIAQCETWEIFIEQNPPQAALASQRSLGQVFSDEGTLDQLKSRVKVLHPYIPPPIEKIRTIAAEIFPDIAQEIAETSDCDLRDLCSQRKVLTCSNQDLTPTQLTSLKTKLEEKGGYGLTKEKPISLRALFEIIENELHIFMERKDVKELNKAHKWGIFIKAKPLQELKPNPEAFFAAYAEKNNGKLPYAQELCETLYHEHGVDIQSVSLVNSTKPWESDIKIASKSDFDYEKVPTEYEEALLKHYEDKKPIDSQVQELVRRTLGIEPARYYLSRLRKNQHKQQKQFSKQAQPTQPNTVVNRVHQSFQLPTVLASQEILSQLKNSLEILHPCIPPTIEKVRKIAAEIFPDIADQIPTISDQDLRDLCSQRKILIYSNQDLTPTQLTSLKTKLEEKGGYGLTKEKKITPRALFETIEKELHIFMERPDVKSLNKTHKWGIFIKKKPLQELKPNPEAFFAAYAEKNNGKSLSSQELSETLYHEHGVDIQSVSLTNSIRQWGTKIPISEKSNFNHRKVPEGYEEALLRHYEDKRPADSQIQEFVRRTLGMEPARHYFSRLQKNQLSKQA